MATSQRRLSYQGTKVIAVSATTDEPVMTDNPRPVLMSIKPRFAEAILDGHKTVELRRIRLSAQPGTLVILYATAPTMAVVGTAIVEARDTDTPASIWRRYRAHMALTKDEFDTYLAGATFATAISMMSPRRLNEIVPLAALREETGFNPPQSYRFVRSDEPAAVRALTILRPKSNH